MSYLLSFVCTIPSWFADRMVSIVQDDTVKEKLKLKGMTASINDKIPIVKFVSITGTDVIVLITV